MLELELVSGYVRIGTIGTKHSRLLSSMWKVGHNQVDDPPCVMMRSSASVMLIRIPKSKSKIVWLLLPDMLISLPIEVFPRLARLTSGSCAHQLQPTRWPMLLQPILYWLWTIGSATGLSFLSLQLTPATQIHMLPSAVASPTVNLTFCQAKEQSAQYKLVTWLK